MEARPGVRARPLCTVTLICIVEHCLTFIAVSLVLDTSYLLMSVVADVRADDFITSRSPQDPRRILWATLGSFVDYTDQVRRRFICALSSYD